MRAVRLAALFALLLRASPSWAAIAVEATSSGDTGTSSPSSLTFSHTVPSSLNNSILTVGVCVGHGDDVVTGITYGGVSLTRVRRDTAGGTSSSLSTYLYRLLAPASGTADVVVSINVSQQIVAGAVTFSGVDQTTPFGTANGNNGNSTGPATVDVTTTTDDVVIDVACKEDSTESPLSIGADQTSQWADQTTLGTVGNNMVGAGSTEPHSTGTATMSWSWTSATREWAITAAPLQEAGGAAAAARRRVIVIQ